MPEAAQALIYNPLVDAVIMAAPPTASMTRFTLQPAQARRSAVKGRWICKLTGSATVSRWVPVAWHAREWGNGDIFTAWVVQCIAPTLVPSDAVIAVNLGSHKSLPARNLIRCAGAHLLFFPSYSPDLNPIELVFAKLRTLSRKADERTIETPKRKAATLSDAFNATKRQNNTRHIGMRQPNSDTLKLN